MIPLTRRVATVTIVLAASTSLQIAHIAAHASSSSVRDAPRERCLDSGWPARSSVTLHLVDHVGLTEGVREEMRRETTAVWHAAGVSVQWSRHAAMPAAGSTEDGRADVYIIAADEIEPDSPKASSLQPRRLASILFVDGKPTPLIRAYPREVQRLLHDVRLDEKAIIDSPRMLRDRLMGRVLGRVVAHELGHFLFGFADHTPSGLMRATHRLDSLLAPSRQAFRVVAPPLPCVVASTDP